ncbi:MAG TPA: MFS transporter [Mesorhizobium sp.]|jgi:FSR family fosmidomycin resistance protein-like MFS transporter|nr:MFS transporter [Mesorhizobium sp.]
MTDAALPQRAPQLDTAYAVIFAVSFCHFLNDILQSLLAALYPMLKEDFSLDFWQIGMLTLAFQVTASLLQPVVGLVTDKHSLPRSLPVGMGASLCGLVLLAFADTYPLLLAGAAMIGLGSAVFHPEASRVARAASGGRFGFAQSTFQVGGNFGHAAGPLLAAFIVVPRGQASVAWFTLAAFLGMAILWQVSSWYARAASAGARRALPAKFPALTRGRIVAALVVLALLTFSKNIYMAGISSYYTFYVIERFGVDVQDSQLLLFVFLAASAVGVFMGGPIGDRWGPKTVIWFSILGVLPFTLALPYADFGWTVALTVAIGLVMSSAFPAILVFAQELVPGRVGLIAGIFFGFAFGMGGIAAAALGALADRTGIEYVFWLISFMPALGLLAIFLPTEGRAAR